MPSVAPIVCSLAVLAATPPDLGVRRYVLLLTLVGIAGFVIVFSVGMWSALRAVRRSGKARRAAASRPPGTIDPWAEAGRRARPEDGDHWLEPDPNDETR